MLFVGNKKDISPHGGNWWKEAEFPVTNAPHVWAVSSLYLDAGVLCLTCCLIMPLAHEGLLLKAVFVCCSSPVSSDIKM